MGFTTLATRHGPPATHTSFTIPSTIDGMPLIDTELFGSVVQMGDQWKVLSYPDR